MQNNSGEFQEILEIFKLTDSCESQNFCRIVLQNSETQLSNNILQNFSEDFYRISQKKKKKIIGKNIP